jgi:hypothetical protein
MSVDRQTSSAAAIEGAVRRMSPELRDQYQTVRRLLSTTTAADARARYKVGVVVLAIKRSVDRYGTRAVALLGTALARNETTLYRYAAVAEAWDETAFEEIQLLKLPGGEPISWCHLQEIAAAPREQRERLLRHVFAKGLSLRELSALARGESPPAPTPRPLGRPLARLKQLATTCEAMDRLIVDEAALLRLLAADPEGAGHMVARAIAAQTKAVGLLERNLATLRKAASGLPVAPASSPEGPKASTPARGFYPRFLAGGTA